MSNESGRFYYLGKKNIPATSQPPPEISFLDSLHETYKPAEDAAPPPIGGTVQRQLRILFEGKQEKINPPNV